MRKARIWLFFLRNQKEHKTLLQIFLNCYLTFQANSSGSFSFSSCLLNLYLCPCIWGGGQKGDFICKLEHLHSFCLTFLSNPSWLTFGTFIPLAWFISSKIGFRVANSRKKMVFVFISAYQLLFKYLFASLNLSLNPFLLICISFAHFTLVLCW